MILAMWSSIGPKSFQHIFFAYPKLNIDKVEADGQSKKIICITPTNTHENILLKQRACFKASLGISSLLFFQFNSYLTIVSSSRLYSDKKSIFLLAMFVN